MYEWKTGSNNIIQLWDFGGQELFYTTHQFFLSKNSIHLLLFNLTDKFMENELFFWLNSIQYRAPGSKVIIIGTHMDTIDPKLMEEEINMISNKIKNIYDKIISNISEKLQDNKIEIIIFVNPINSFLTIVLKLNPLIISSKYLIFHSSFPLIG